MNSTAFIPVGDVLLNVTQEIGDTQMRYGRPFYMDTMFRAVRQMAIETGFDVRHWDGDIPENRIVHLPSVAGIEGIWVYSGTECDINVAQPVWIKPHMHHTGGAGRFENTKWAGGDALNYPAGSTRNPPSNMYFAGIGKDQLELSESCLQHKKLHVTYNGLGAECWGDDVEIPQWAAEAIVDWCVKKVAQIMRRRDPNYYTRLIQEKDAELKGINGSWQMAKVQWSAMDAKDRHDMAAYMGRYGKRG